MKKTMELTRSLAGRVYNAARASWNSSRPRTRLAVAAVPLTTVAISVFAAGLLFPSQILANNADEVSTFTVDVAESTVNYTQNNVDRSEGRMYFLRATLSFWRERFTPPASFRAARQTTIPMLLEGSASTECVEVTLRTSRTLKRRSMVSRTRLPR
jgi:hypothetical protein